MVETVRIEVVGMYNNLRSGVVGLGVVAGGKCNSWKKVVLVDTGVCLEVAVVGIGAEAEEVWGLRCKGSRVKMEGGLKVRYVSRGAGETTGEEQTRGMGVLRNYVAAAQCFGDWVEVIERCLGNELLKPSDEQKMMNAETVQRDYESWVELEE